MWFASSSFKLFSQKNQTLENKKSLDQHQVSFQNSNHF